MDAKYINVIAKNGCKASTEVNIDIRDKRLNLPWPEPKKLKLKPITEEVCKISGDGLVGKISRINSVNY